MDELFKPLLSGTTPSPPKFNVNGTWNALAPMDEKNQTPNITFANTRAETLRFGGAGVQRSACCRVWIFCPSTVVYMTWLNIFMYSLVIFSFWISIFMMSLIFIVNELMIRSTNQRWFFTAVTVGHQEPLASEPAEKTSTAAASATKPEDGYPKAGMCTIF